MGIKISIRVLEKKSQKMKFSAAVLATVAVAQDGDRKVPPRHPLQRLNRLVEFSHELLDDWYTWLPSQDSWKGKFERNAERMERNFERGNQRCGFYDKINSHMVVHLKEESEKSMLTQSGIDMTVKIHQLEPSKSQLVSENGLKDISQNAQAKETTIIKLTE